MRVRKRTSVASLAGALAIGLALGACEPPAAESLLGPGPESRPLTVLSHGVGPSGALEVRFSRSLDPNSVGSRSVRLLSPRGRVGCRTAVAGDTLSVRPTGGRKRSLRSLVLRLEGDPSPRALRASDGSALPARVEVGFSLPARAQDDRTRPRLTASTPLAGERDVSPGGAIALTFSEPLDRGVVRAGRGASVYAAGELVPVRLRLSGDRTMLVLKPRVPLPAGSEVVVRASPELTDAAGNPVLSPDVRFRVRAASFREVREEFVGQEMADLSGTSCSWCGPEAPGFLVWGSGRRALGPRLGEGADLDLGERRRVHFQMLFPPDEGGEPSFASAIRIFLTSRDRLEGVRSVTVEAGTTDLASVEPTFEGNRLLSRLLPDAVVRVGHAIDVQSYEDEALGSIEVAFEQPLPVPPGQGVLIDVQLELAPGVRLAAVPDALDQALVDGASGGLLLPAVQLLVSGGPPQARSHWYDTGAVQPQWRRASVVADQGSAGVDARFEFQTAPGRGDGAPDLDRASDWSPDLAELPAHRFVRFRARFVGFPDPAALPRIDRLVMPYESR